MLLALRGLSKPPFPIWTGAKFSNFECGRSRKAALWYSVWGLKWLSWIIHGSSESRLLMLSGAAFALLPAAAPLARWRAATRCERKRLPCRGPQLPWGRRQDRFPFSAVESCECAEDASHQLLEGCTCSLGPFHWSNLCFRAH